MKFKVTTSDQKAEYVEARCFDTDNGELKFYKDSDKDEFIAVYTRGTWTKVTQVFEDDKS
jgi:hypothetical protein